MIIVNLFGVSRVWSYIYSMSKINIITRDQAKNIIHLTNGKFFNVKFIKKDGSTRIMNCRLGVKKHLKGGELKYNPSDYNLVPVFCFEKKSYRMININTIQELKVSGSVFGVV